MDNILKIAETLSEIRATIEKEEKEFEEKVASLKTERDTLQSLLVTELEKSSLKSIKTTKENYALAIRHGINITSDISAMKWALENRAVQIDKKLVVQKLKDVETLPQGFEKVETKYISIRKNNEK